IFVNAILSPSLRDATGSATSGTDNRIRSGDIPISTTLAPPDDNFRHASENFFLIAKTSDPHLIPPLSCWVKALFRVQRPLVLPFPGNAADHSAQEQDRVGTLSPCSPPTENARKRLLNKVLPYRKASCEHTALRSSSTRSFRRRSEMP